MKIQKDIFGIEPGIGDIIIFNPTGWKGIAYGNLHSFDEKGKPIINNIVTQFKWAKDIVDEDGFYTPKTGFVVKSK